MESYYKGIRTENENAQGSDHENFEALRKYIRMKVNDIMVKAVDYFIYFGSLTQKGNSMKR
jgi:hypothetical protein